MLEQMLCNFPGYVLCTVPSICHEIEAIIYAAVADALKLPSCPFQRREICLCPNVRLTSAKVEVDDTEFRIRTAVGPTIYMQEVSVVA